MSQIQCYGFLVLGVVVVIVGVVVVIVVVVGSGSSIKCERQEAI